MLNSRQANISCGQCKNTGKAYPEVTPSFFAEFLNEDSLVHLRLLASSTCVGLRYGLNLHYEPTSKILILLQLLILGYNFVRFHKMFSS